MFQSNLLWQNDDQWANEPLGFGPPTIKQWGCLMSSLTMVVNGFGAHETPKTFNDKMKANDGFAGAMIKPAVVPSIFPGVSLRGRDNCENASAPIAAIDAALASGMPVIVQVDYSPEQGVQSHWVLAYARAGNDYLVLDPYRYPGDAPGKPLTLLSRYHYSGPTLQQAITSVIYMAGTPSGGGAPIPVPVAQPKPKAVVPTPALTVLTSQADLALRADPAVSGALITRLPQNCALTVLEPLSQAQAKVGQYNQWLQVQNPAGEQGYVAAWYVVAGQGSQPAPTTGAGTPGGATPPPAAAGADLILLPTVEGLALRAQGDVSADLIKRLPITAQLKTLDPAGEAAKKLGAQGQWIHVRDIAGAEGYVAAWYVTAADNPALGVKTPPADGGTPTPTLDLIVRTTDDQVALRSSPGVADNNLIKRLPLRAQLLVTEPGGASKIGAPGQWLAVKDLEGVAGFVAAWYVSM